MAKIVAGTKVLVRFFNTPERKFYGAYYQAIVKEVTTNRSLFYSEKRYLVFIESRNQELLVMPKEIKGVLK